MGLKADSNLGNFYYTYAENGETSAEEDNGGDLEDEDSGTLEDFEEPEEEEELDFGESAPRWIKGLR